MTVGRLDAQTDGNAPLRQPSLNRLAFLGNRSGLLGVQLKYLQYVLRDIYPDYVFSHPSCRGRLRLSVRMPGTHQAQPRHELGRANGWIVHRRSTVRGGDEIYIGRCLSRGLREGKVSPSPASISPMSGTKDHTRKDNGPFPLYRASGDTVRTPEIPYVRVPRYEDFFAMNRLPVGYLRRDRCLATR
jgi:hypothetical protein